MASADRHPASPRINQGTLFARRALVQFLTCLDEDRVFTAAFFDRHGRMTTQDSQAAFATYVNADSDSAAAHAEGHRQHDPARHTPASSPQTRRLGQSDRL
jgi:hypothetical protein